MSQIASIAATSNPFATGIRTEVVSNENKVTNFSDVIKGAIEKVNDSQVNANNKIEGLVKGEDVSMHDVMLSVQESQMSMQLMLEVRNKLYDAYKELSSVQL